MGAVFFCVLKSGFSQTLIYGIENEIKDFNLLTSFDKNAFILNELFTQSLFSRKVDGSLEPDLVESTKYLAAEWRLKIKEATYSNSKKLECEDIVFNLKEAQASKSILGLRLKDVTSIRCSGRELRIKTLHPSPELMQRVGSVIRIYEPTTLKKKIPIGSGPYMIQSQRGKDLVLVLNPFFKGNVTFTEIRFRTLRDPWLRDLALMSGNIDFLLESFSHTRIRSFEKKSLLRVYRNPSQILHYIGFNEKKVKKKTRKILQQYLSSSTFVSHFWGTDVLPSPKIFERAHLERNEKKYQVPESSPLTLELSCIADETNVQFLSLLAKDLRSRGVNLKIRPLEFATFMKAMNTQNFESYFFYVDVSHVQNLEALLASKGNRLGVENSNIDRVFFDFQKNFNSIKSEQILEEINNEEAYLIPLYKGKKILAASQNIHIDQSPRGFWKDLIQAIK